MPSSVARRSTWSRRPSDTQAFRQPAATCMRGRPTAARATWLFDGQHSAMSPLAFDPGVGKATTAIQSAIDRGDTVWIEQAIVALARLAPIDAVLPRVLRDAAVWSQAQRDDLLTSAKSHHPGVHLQTETVGVNFGSLLDEMNAAARADQAPIVNELHLAEALVKLGGSALTRTGVNGPLLIARVAEMLGRKEPSPGDLAKTWCFCDTTFFQESRAPFDQVDWPGALGLASVVLVVAPVVVRELDQQKSDPRPHRSRQQGRARQVLSRLDPIIDQRVGEQPVPLRKG